MNEAQPLGVLSAQLVTVMVPYLKHLLDLHLQLMLAKPVRHRSLQKP